MTGNAKLGPALPHLFSLGADLVVEQGTKFLASQSDLLSGVILGKDPALIGRASKMRSLLAETQQPGLPAYAGSL
jgi:cystathionine beta-lyase/cystathionine gamma-synthase